MNNEFRWSEFGGKQGELDADRYFEDLHSPELGYAHIQKSIASLETGLNAIDDELMRKQAGVYAYVSVFRDTMQYAEEFGIYLYSKLDDETDFVDALTRTDTHQTKSLFKMLSRENYDEIVAQHSSKDISFNTWIAKQFGYDKTLTKMKDVPLSELYDGDEKLLTKRTDKAVEHSIQRVKQKMTRIAEFFLRFDEPYNAVKHGNRVMPTLSLDASFEGFGERVNVDSDEPFVTFLCKTSGEIRQGKRYTFTVPARILQEASAHRANEIHSLYTQLYDVAQTKREAEDLTAQERREQTVDINFYGIHETDNDGGAFQFQSVENPDGAIWVPQKMIDEPLPVLSELSQNEFTAALEKEGDSLVIETNGDSDLSYENPIQIEAEFSNDPDRLIGSRANFNFNWHLLSLPLWQYREMVKLQDESPYTSVTLRHTGVDEERTQKLDVPIESPPVPEPDDRGLMKFIWRLGLAADTEIYTPAYIPDSAYDVLESYRGQEITSEMAEECLDKLFKSTEDEIANRVTVSILNSDTPSGDNLSVIKSAQIDFVEGAIVCELDENDRVIGFDLVDATDERVKKGEPNEQEALVMGPIDNDIETTFESFKENQLGAIEDIEFSDSLEESNSILEMKREYGPRFTMYKIDTFKIGIYPEAPLHAEEFLTENF
ncbi:hypothetical protein ACT4ML_19870 [Natrinema sp. LN54]|uniref:hypothetical protein n=1 Tax=Natrinema sp. LN54 TaxID=3458705 RepID=UPI00403542D0